MPSPQSLIPQMHAMLDPVIPAKTPSPDHKKPFTPSPQQQPPTAPQGEEEEARVQGAAGALMAWGEFAKMLGDDFMSNHGAGQELLKVGGYPRPGCRQRSICWCLTRLPLECWQMQSGAMIGK